MERVSALETGTRKGGAIGLVWETEKLLNSRGERGKGEVLSTTKKTEKREEKIRLSRGLSNARQKRGENYKGGGKSLRTTKVA